MLDRICARAAIWLLRRFFGECKEFVAEDLPHLHCVGCDSARLIRIMQARLAAARNV